MHVPSVFWDDAVLTTSELALGTGLVWALVGYRVKRAAPHL